MRKKIKKVNFNGISLTLPANMRRINLGGREWKLYISKDARRKRDVLCFMGLFPFTDYPRWEHYAANFHEASHGDGIRLGPIHAIEVNGLSCLAFPSRWVKAFGLTEEQLGRIVAYDICLPTRRIGTLCVTMTLWFGVDRSKYDSDMEALEHMLNAPETIELLNSIDITDTAGRPVKDAVTITEKEFLAQLERGEKILKEAK